MKSDPVTLITTASTDYELLDSGEGEKLERYGPFTLARPDPQALWPKNLPVKRWKEADASFSRSAGASWICRKELPKRWQIEYNDLRFWIKPSAFKHTGLFPEQSQNWSWLRKIIASRKEPVSILNLFGYTGGATLASTLVGASVCHVDSSKAAVEWARENADLSGLADRPIRWIVDDVRKFVGRELNRGKRYDGIIMDPPTFGHGKKGELWKIEEDFLPLLTQCRKLLSDKPLLFLINGYASGYSPITYANNLATLMQEWSGSVEMGELTIQESGPSSRMLPAGIFARWTVGS